MNISQSLLPEFDNEMANTRKVLERVPMDKADFRPHPKSGTMAWLATHVGNLPSWAKMVMQTDELNLQGMGPQPAITTADELLATFDRNAQDAREAIAKADDAEYMKNWALKMGGHVLFTMPKIAVYRSVVMNHLIHHRAQLTVYLRLNDVEVPGMYGPSADEASSFTRASA